jgi:hypothetical protein
MLNDVSAAFNGWLRDVVIRRPSGSGAYVAGTWVPAATVNITIRGVLQNANPDDLQNLPEGLRTSEAIKVHSVERMVPVSESSQALADVILEDGKEYIVQSVANRKIGNYYKAIAVKRKAS